MQSATGNLKLLHSTQIIEMTVGFIAYKSMIKKTSNAKFSQV